MRVWRSAQRGSVNSLLSNSPQSVSRSGFLSAPPSPCLDMADPVMDISPHGEPFREGALTLRHRNPSSRSSLLPLASCAKLMLSSHSRDHLGWASAPLPVKSLSREAD